MKQKIALLLLLVIIAIHSRSQNQHDQLEKYFTALAQNRGFTGNVLIADQGKIIYEGSFGYSDPSTKKLNTPGTQFPICSITKTFVATSILQLQEKGKLRLDDEVVKYLPAFPYPTITIRQLLSHTSGLPGYYGWFDSLIAKHPDTLLTNKDFVNACRVMNKPLMARPGDQFNYNNANFVILAIIVTKITGLEIDSYISSHILKPLGMFHTFVCDYLHLPVKKKAGIAAPYFWPHLYSDEMSRSDTIPFLLTDARNFNFNGFGDMVSTLHDLLLYDEALYSGKLLKPGTLEEAYTPVKLNNGKSNPGVWGLGWQIDQVGKMVNHGGGMAGMYLSLTRNLDRHQTAIVFSISREALSRPVANNALKILNGQIIYPKKSAAYEYGEILVKKGPVAAEAALETAKKDTTHYDINIREFNSLGYDLMGDAFIYNLPAVHHYTEALQVFKLNTELFPAIWNVYDNYAAALAETGNKEEAIKIYKKSLELNPQNTDAAAALKRLDLK